MQSVLKCKFRPLSLSLQDVLQAKLFKAHYLLYQEHVLRDYESNVANSVLTPLYQSYNNE